jgi:perosamine synthetase
VTTVIPEYRPSFDDEEWEALREPLRSGWVGLGPKTKEFEQAFARYVGAPHAVALNSGTAALHLALKVLGVEGSEVITTSLTYVATNHAILYNNAVPVFADIEEDTLNIDPREVERLISPRTKAVVVVHYAGHPCDMDPILEMTRAKGIKVVEDAAHACGAAYKGRKIGSLSGATCFSFDTLKNLATGSGGMITLYDPKLDARLRKLRWLGISRDTWTRAHSNGRRAWYYEVDEVGYRYHMTDLAAGIGLVQLRKLERLNARRRELVRLYDRCLADLDWVQTPVVKEYATSSHHKYVIRARGRDGLITHLRERGISANVHFVPNHFHPPYRRFRADLPVTERVWKELVTLPLFPDMTDAQVEEVVSAIKSYRRHARSPSHRRQAQGHRREGAARRVERAQGARV